MPVDLNKYREEVESALPNETKWMDRALERQAFYDYEGARYERHFRREAEAWQDYKERSHRGSGFLRECIGKLCQHLYSPGPGRRWDEAGGDEFLQRVWTDNLIDSLMLEADKLSTLNSVVAIQIDPGSERDENNELVSDFEDKPITYRLWGREHFCAWTSDDDDRVIEACCTKDMFKGQIRYRLWSDTECWTFITKKESPNVAGGIPTSGGRVASLVPEESGPHGYGCLPFTFIHYELPVKCFDTVAIGEFLWKAEICIDNRLMKTDESIDKHLDPVLKVTGVEATWKPAIRPLGFLRLPRTEGSFTNEGYIPGDPPDASLLEFHIDVAGSWEDLRNYIDLCLEASGIPKSAVRMEQMGVASGIALMIEQEPLIKRAEGRRLTFKVYECDLAYKTLCVGGNHYGKPALIATAEKGTCTLSWPQPRLAVLTQDLLDVESVKVQLGVSSHLMMIQNLYGFTRAEALEFVEQIKEDTAEMEKLFPEGVAATKPADPQADADAEHQRNLEAIEAKKKGES